MFAPKYISRAPQSYPENLEAIVAAVDEFKRTYRQTYTQTHEENYIHNSLVDVKLRDFQKNKLGLIKETNF